MKIHYYVNCTSQSLYLKSIPTISEEKKKKKCYSTVKKYSSMQVEAAVPFTRLISYNIKQIVISRLQLKKTTYKATPRGFGRELVKHQKQQFIVIALVHVSSPFYKSTGVFSYGVLKVLEGSSPLLCQDTNHSFIILTDYSKSPDFKVNPTRFLLKCSASRASLFTLVGMQLCLGGVELLPAAQLM